ncbi:DUF84 family protein [Salibacterium salarium]|uniref:inosine/xanthosine triphosphatase n=1 Tax=Salibacterium salarium TaxID=284579 RepID=A0A428N786_9BACI|nr:DUF84 family protein [Salibacterium salarium]RSL34237.1 DUF84 family protein [Salibacterium salarium]
MKRCGVGSKNQAKLQAVASVFAEVDYDVQGFDVDSTVSAQPFSDEETKAGAISRAKAVLEKDVEIGIGLEGGVMQMNDGLYLCNWGAIADKQNHVFTAAGAKILLPEEIANGLHRGEELKTVMDLYTNRHGVSHEEGAVGIFTNGVISRADMFIHTVRLLYGQRCFYLS